MLRKLVLIVALGCLARKLLASHGRDDRNGHPAPGPTPGARTTRARTRSRAAARPARKSRSAKDSDAKSWDMVDERSDESFPASDPPGTY